MTIFWLVLQFGISQRNSASMISVFSLLIKGKMCCRAHHFDDRIAKCTTKVLRVFTPTGELLREYRNSDITEFKEARSEHFYRNMSWEGLHLCPRGSVLDILRFDDYPEWMSSSSLYLYIVGSAVTDGYWLRLDETRTLGRPRGFMYSILQTTIRCIIFWNSEITEWRLHAPIVLQSCFPCPKMMLVVLM